MKYVMVWIFPFSALVSVQNIADKVVGRKRKSYSIHKNICLSKQYVTIPDPTETL